VSVATQTPGARLAAAGSSPPSRGGGGWIWTRGVPVVAVLLGLVLRLRLREYTFNRSLFPDEVTLTHDVVGRTFGQLLHVNPNGQAAPIGWLWTSKVATVVFGQHDLTLRLVPFLASVVALLLFPYVGRELVGRWAMPAALLLFATSPALIYYASEAKQYSSDVTCTLLALAITLAVYQRRPGPRPALAWALLASGVIWFSQPGILLVALGGAVLALRWLRRPQGLRWLIVAAVPPLVVLGIDYVVVLRDQAASTLLKNYWAAGSPPAPLQLRSASSWLYRDVNDALGDPGHLAHPVLVLTLCAVGALVLVSRRAWRWPTLLLLSPLLIAVIVGVARVYPLRQRLALYLLPLVYLLMCSGLRVLDQALRPRLRIWGQGVVAAVVAVMVGVTRDRGSPAESRSWPARWITPFADHYRKGDAIYREYPWAAVDYSYYAPRHPQLARPGLFRFVSGHAACAHAPDLSRLRVHQRAWVYFEESCRQGAARLHEDLPVLLPECGHTARQLHPPRSVRRRLPVPGHRFGSGAAAGLAAEHVLRPPVEVSQSRVTRCRARMYSASTPSRQVSFLPSSRERAL